MITEFESGEQYKSPTHTGKILYVFGIGEINGVDIVLEAGWVDEVTNKMGDPTEVIILKSDLGNWTKT